MKRILCFRPGVIGNSTAFEAQSLIYKYIQKHYDYHFIIVKSENDNYYDEELETLSIPNKGWKGNLDKLDLPKFIGINKYGLDKLFTQADGVVTVDPTLYPQGLLAIKLAHELEKPIWVDASLTFAKTTQNLVWQLKRRFLFRKALHEITGIFVTVPKCIERFRELGLLDDIIAPKFTIMGHPVDTQRFVPEPKKSEQDGILRVLVVSRMMPEKGVLYILEAMTPLLRSRSNLQLQFLGSGPMRSLLQTEVKERELSDKVIILDPVPHSQIPAILGEADIFVNHAVSIGFWEEYFGIANLEAMSCGLPCVLTNCGGISYSIREKDVAVFVEQRNIVQLREAILRLIDSEEEREKIGKKGREYVESYYALAKLANKYYSILERNLS